MSELSNVLAKSPGRTGGSGEQLTEHLAATLRAARELRDRVGRLAVAPERFWDRVAWAALTHDAGKVAQGFQAMMLSAPGPGKGWGQRHEVLSLGFLPHLLGVHSEVDREWVGLGVLTHHRPLTSGAAPGPGKLPINTQYGLMTADEFATEIGAVDPMLVTELTTWLARHAEEAGLHSPAAGAVDQDAGGSDVVATAYDQLGHLLDRWEHVSADAGLAAVLMQGAVTLADHVSSAHGVLHTLPLLDASYRARLESRLDARGHALLPHQRAAAAVEGHVLLRAPTGSGKTEAAELWAATQVESLRASVGGTPRVFVTLPYLASINTMVDRLQWELDTAEGIGVAHSRAASYYLARSLGDEDASAQAASGKALSRAAATKLFRETTRVGTPYQLLRGALAGPAHASILVDSANSVFVLDELHAYDPERLGMILAGLELWERLGGRIAVMSATLPMALVELVQETLNQPVRVVEAEEGWPARHRVRLDERHLTAPESLTAIMERLEAGQAVLVVANNVGHAREIYAALSPYIKQRYGVDSCQLLHSRFRRGDRSQIEQRVMARFASGQPRKPGLLVATQVVEVSLDVDFDVLHTSGAPLEPLLQRFGRVNRLGERPPSDVVIHKPSYGPRRGSREEHADGVYEAEPTALTWDILAENDAQVIDEQQVNKWLDRVYGSAWGQRWRARVDDVRADFARSFLSFPQPFADRSDLEDKFDELFEGEEALLADDRDAYREQLLDAGGAPGRLLAEEYLLPLPVYGSRRARWDRELRVRVIDADYNEETGLGALREPASGHDYSPGEIM